jgi:hypothetical protein
MTPDVVSLRSTLRPPPVQPDTDRSGVVAQGRWDEKARAIERPDGHGEEKNGKEADGGGKL